MSHILVIEDDVNNARLFKLILERKGGFEVTTLNRFDNIFELIAEKSSSLIIMDVSLAHARFSGRDVDGTQLTRILKSDERTKNLPVILVTAHAVEGDKEMFLNESGADDYIPKPITDPDLLIEMVQNLLS